jgi:hypothetical protein
VRERERRELLMCFKGNEGGRSQKEGGKGGDLACLGLSQWEKGKRNFKCKISKIKVNRNSHPTGTKQRLVFLTF